MWKKDFLTCPSMQATKLFFQQAVEYKQPGVAAKLLLKKWQELLAAFT